MNEVYKIIGKFENKDFSKMIKQLSAKFVCMYVDENLFIAPKSWEEKNEAVLLMKKIFKPARDFYIDGINEKNINYQSPIVKEWCLNNLVRLDTERYTIENQEHLKKVWGAMDKMEEELISQLKQRKEE